MPEWTTADLIPYICRHIDDVHALAALSTVNKAFNNYLFSTTGGKHWIRAGRLVCGEEYWPNDEQSRWLEETDPRYLTKIRICPWLSMPTEIQEDEEEPIIWFNDTGVDSSLPDKLNMMRWAPQKGEHYGKMIDIIKLHDSVSIIISEAPVSYFISHKNNKLLKDTFNFVDRSTKHIESWARSIQGNIFWRIQALYQERNHTVYQFGIRQDKLLLPTHRTSKPKLTRACWSAYRGDNVKDAVKEIRSEFPAYPYLLKCHNQCMAQHVINGGSLNTLKELLQEEPNFANEDTLFFAIHERREDMAELIVSKTNPNKVCRSGLIWSILTNQLILIREGLDINLSCAWYFIQWINDSSVLMSDNMRLSCTICAKMKIPTADGRQLVDIMREYTTQFLANYDDYEDESTILLRYKMKSTMELLTAYE